MGAMPSTKGAPRASTALLRDAAAGLTGWAMMNAKRTVALGLAAAALALQGCARRASQAPAAQAAAAQPFRITVQLDWVAEPEHGGLYQALAKGYFMDAGLDVVLVQGGPTRS